MAQRYTRIHCLCFFCSMLRKCCRLICVDLFMSRIMIMSMSMTMTILNIVTIISHLASSSIIEHLSASIRHLSSSAIKDQRRLQEWYASSHVSVAFLALAQEVSLLHTGIIRIARESVCRKTQTFGAQYPAQSRRPRSIPRGGGASWSRPMSGICGAAPRRNAGSFLAVRSSSGSVSAMRSHS